MKTILSAILLVLALGPQFPAMAARQGELDRVVFGDETSEEIHAFSDDGSSRIEVGPSGATCRRILKPETASWKAGPLSVTLDVVPSKPVFLTLQLWGGDVSHDHLFATVDGKMLGQMHLGEYDLLDYESCWPRDAERTTADADRFGVFTYRTFVLPESLTRGKDTIRVSIYAAGHIWGYGSNFEQFQKMVSHDSRGLYSLTAHLDPLPDFSEALAAQLSVSAPEAVDPSMIEPDLATLRRKMEKHLTWLMTTDALVKRLGDVEMLAEAYRTKDSVAYTNAAAVRAIVAAVDAQAIAERTTPGSVLKDEWRCAGPTAIGVAKLDAVALAPYLDEEVSVGGGSVPRRTLWAELYGKSVEFLMAHRRFFANQGQIIDTSAMWCNRALKICDPARGPALAVTRQHVKEAMGLVPAPNGYVAITSAGLSKEDGYVGSYGESTIWAAEGACDAARLDDGSVDPELRAQLVKTTKARLYMRYPSVRRDGSRVARLEAQISWRNEHFTPAPTYLTNGADLRNAILAKDLSVLGAVRDMYQDGVLAEYAAALKGNDRESLRFLADWPKVKKAIELLGEKLPSLPCFGGDFTWCDPENAVVVAKRGEEMLFVEAYWRARGGINNLAKVHLVTPRGEWTALVPCEETFTQVSDKNGRPKFEKIGNWFQYGWMGKFYREGYTADDPSWPPENATAGAQRPVAELGGRADFYVVRYGDWSVAINDSRKNQVFRLDGTSVAPQSCLVNFGKK